MNKYLKIPRPLQIGDSFDDEGEFCNIIGLQLPIACEMCDKLRELQTASIPFQYGGAVSSKQKYFH